MAIAYLNEGATSLAAANWSDATGFGAAATLVINGGTQVISGGLSQTASSIESLDIYGFGGIIGGATGALECDVDGTSESATSAVSRLRFWSPGTMFFKANGGNTLAHFIQLRDGNMYLTGGICKNVHMDSGYLKVSDSVTATSGVWEIAGGTADLDYHASNNIPQINCHGGSHNFKKQITALYMYGGSATVDCQGLAITTLELYGGASVRLVSCGGITNFRGKGGTLDCTDARRAISVGSSVCVLGSSLTIKTNPAVTFGTKTTIGGGPKGLA